MDPISRLLNACESGDLETVKSILAVDKSADEAVQNEQNNEDNEENEDDDEKDDEMDEEDDDGGNDVEEEEGDQDEDEDEDEDGDEDEDEDFAPSNKHMSSMFYTQMQRATTESRDRWKITPLGAAIMGHQLDIVELLLSVGANVNGVIENSSLVHYACAIGGVGGDTSRNFAEACVHQLIQAGARIDARDEFLRTPLHIAAASGLQGAIAMLSRDSNKKHVDIQDNRGQTALHVAARNSNHACMQQLLNCGATKSITDHRGRTASHHAAEVGDKQGSDMCTDSANAVSVDGLGQTVEQILAAASSTTTRLPTLLVYPHQSIEHKTAVSIARGKNEPPPENEQRIHVLVNDRFGTLRASEFDGRVKWEEASPRASLADILRVHDHMYVNMVKTRCEACAPVDAKTASGNKLAQLDMDTVMSRDSYEAAMYAAGAACHAVDRIMSGDCRNAFCVVRPPGHHAGPRGLVTGEDDPDGGSHGFCLFNNVAVAAGYARHMYRHVGLKRVAILDFDVHHGNGTEALVRNLEPSIVTNTFPSLFGDLTMESPSYKPWLDESDSDNVLFVSLHGYGHGFYPSSGRTSADRPVFNVGWPLCKDKDQASREWRQAWRNAVMPALKDFKPDMIFLSCGLDGHRKDEMNHGFVCLQVSICIRICVCVCCLLLVACHIPTSTIISF